MHKTSVRKCEKTKNILNEIKGGNGMLKKMRKRLNNEKGLTLVELLAVIVILGIVAAIAIPSIGNIINNSEIKAAKADALNILNAANLYSTENPEVTKIVYTSPSTYTEYKGASDATGANSNFNQFIQSKGVFNDTGFTIFIAADKTVSIFAEDIKAGGETINFGTSTDGATIDEIKANTADEQAGIVDFE